jgi:hypothetical protein
MTGKSLRKSPLKLLKVTCPFEAAGSRDEMSPLNVSALISGAAPPSRGRDRCCR